MACHAEEPAVDGYSLSQSPCLWIFISINGHWSITHWGRRCQYLNSLLVISCSCTVCMHTWKPRTTRKVSSHIFHSQLRTMVSVFLFLSKSSASSNRIRVSWMKFQWDFWGTERNSSPKSADNSFFLVIRWTKKKTLPLSRVLFKGIMLEYLLKLET